MVSVRQLFQRAISLVRQMRLIEARDLHDDHLRHDERDPHALACRGWIHALHRQPRLARADLEAALRHAPVGWPRAAEVRAQLAIEADYADVAEIAALVSEPVRPVQLIA